MRSPYSWTPGRGRMLIRSPPFFKMFRITRAERSSIRTAVASFYKEAMQNLFKLLPVALALGAIISSSTLLLAQPEQPTPDELRAKISQDLPGWLKQYNVPSASVAYIANGRLAWTVVAGEQSPGVPATDKTLYNIASLTKPIVAETILRLASQNKLQLDESIYPYWVDPDIKNNPWNKLLTPRLCLSHQTGFANWRRMTNGSLHSSSSQVLRAAIRAKAFSTSLGLRRTRQGSHSIGSHRTTCSALLA